MKICCENENYELRGRISDYETMLEKYGFVRVNIGFIINCKYIKTLKTKKIILSVSYTHLTLPTKRIV